MTTAFALVLVWSAAATPQDAPAPIDTSFVLSAKRPLLVAIQAKVGGKAAIASGATRQEISLDASEERELVDEIVDAGTASYQAKRTIVKDFATERGVVTDPPLNGATIVFTGRTAQAGFALEGGRVLPKKEVPAMQRTSPSVGFWLELPKQAKVGERYAIDLGPIVSMLVSNDLAEASGKADVALESVDPKTGIARFRGKATLVEKGDMDGVPATVTYDTECTIEVAPAEARIASMTMSGKFSMKGQGPIDLAGDGTYTLNLSTQIGTAADAARKRKPTYRDRVFRMEDIGVELALPSQWAEVESKPEFKHTYQRMVSGPETAVIVFFVMEGVSDEKKFYTDFSAGLKSQHPDLKTEKVTSPLGNGQAYSFASAADGVNARVEAYPTRGRAIAMRVVADPKTFSGALSDFSRARKSLKLMTQ
jgi:hypothetical protein